MAKKYWGRTIHRTEPKFITRKDLALLCTSGSAEIPHAINDGGVRYEWVGIGWVRVSPAHGNEVRVQDD